MRHYFIGSPRLLFGENTRASKMGDDPGVFSDDDLEVSGRNDPPPIKTSAAGNASGRKRLGFIPIFPPVSGVHTSESSEMRSRSRSSTPTPSNGNVTHQSPPSTNGGTGQHPLNGNSFFSSHQNPNGSTTQFSLLPVPPQTPRSRTPTRANQVTLCSASHIVFAGTFAIILALLYACIGLTSELATFRSELRETMNNYQMHLINLQNLHRLEAKEGREREKRLIARNWKMEALLREIAKALRPNLLEGIVPSSHDPLQPTKKEKKEGLLSLLEEIQSESPRQPRETFVQLLSTIGETMSQESRPAGVILLIPPNLRSSSFPSCFARKLAKGINRIFLGSSHEVDPQELSLRDLLETPDLGSIHADLKSYFTYEGGKSVLVHNLEEIQSYEMLMMIHAFCDNVLAYDTEATFIFTVRVPDEVAAKYNWVDENGYRITYDTLMTAWSSVLTPDKTPALISRIAMANIPLREGDTC